MVKIFQGELPKRINVVVDREQIGVAVFDENGVFETDNKAIIDELVRYGYKAELPEVKSEVVIKPKKKGRKNAGID